ncbi:type II secretion system protein E [Achromatium sp. WMS2]|nr:type II secretion system protein E [Achromatium sp. WMS2]
MNKGSFQPLTGERRLTLYDILPLMAADGLIQVQQVNDFQRLWDKISSNDIHIHPLVWIANKNLNDLRTENTKLTLENLTIWLADRLSLQFFRIDPLKINLEAITGVVSQAYANRFSILPVHVGPREITFATCEPLLREWETDLNRMLRKHIKRVLASPVDIARYQDELFSLRKSMQRANSQVAQDTRSSELTNIEALVELGKAGKLDANDHHVISVVDWLLQFAFDQRASDIHMEPRRDTGNVRFRIDGILQNVYQMPAPVLTAVIARIKAIGRMDVVERRRPQDGRLKTRIVSGGQEIEMRLSIMPTAFGEKLVMRIFDPQVLLLDVSKLGFSPEDNTCWEEMTSQTHGIILVTGPTGSGKTTTLYSTLKRLATSEVNVSTIEDPVEMVEPSFNQMQVNPGVELDFASGVRTLLRQDPDVIMIGEIRDLETAQMAIQAALTGHLVLSTLHTNDAISTIVRLQNLGVPSYLISATLIGIVAQRLVRTICPHCKQSMHTDPVMWSNLVANWPLTMPAEVHQGLGCNECRNTGYKGRIGLYEILQVTPSIRALITDDINTKAIRDLALRQGMEPLRISGVRKISTGFTTIDEVLRTLPLLSI